MHQDFRAITFTYKQDVKLKRYVKEFGENWDLVSKKSKKFTPEQCFNRYQHIKDMKIIKVTFTDEEDKLLKEKVEAYGKRWYIVVKFFSGKTQNDLKNRYYRHIRKENPDNLKKENTYQQTSNEVDFNDFQLNEEDYFDFGEPFINSIM